MPRRRPRIVLTISIWPPMKSRVPSPQMRLVPRLQLAESRQPRSPNTAEAAIDAAIAGFGITRVLSYQAASALRAGTLARTLRKFEPAPWPVSLVYAGQGLLPLKLRAFLDFAAPRLKGRLAQSEE